MDERVAGRRFTARSHGSPETLRVTHGNKRRVPKIGAEL